MVGYGENRSFTERRDGWAWAGGWPTAPARAATHTQLEWAPGGPAMTELEEAAAKILRCWPAAALSLHLNPMMNAAVRKDSFFFFTRKKDSGQAAASLWPHTAALQARAHRLAAL